MARRPGGTGGRGTRELERFIIADDVEFAADDGPAPLVVIEGPQADRVLVAVTGESAADLAPFAHRAMTFDGDPVRVVVITPHRR